MDNAMGFLRMQAIQVQLDSCEEEIAALAREALSPSTTGARRAEALMRRAAIQTRSVALSRDLQRLRMTWGPRKATPEDAEGPDGLREFLDEESDRFIWAR